MRMGGWRSCMEEMGTHGHIRCGPPHIRWAHTRAIIQESFGRVFTGG